MKLNLRDKDDNLKKLKIVLVVASILFILIYLLLTYKFATGFISNLQVYTSIQLISIMFWIFIILISIILLISDTGILKGLMILVIIISVYILVFQVVYVRSSYEVIYSDKYELIVETVKTPGSEGVKVYKKDGIFFSELVGSANVSEIYDISYEIVGDTFVIRKCTEYSCDTHEIELD